MGQAWVGSPYEWRTVSDYLNRRLLDDHIQPSVNRVAVRIVDHYENVADYDAHIPPAESRVRCPGQHREWLHNQADYEANIPPRFNRVAVIKGIRFEKMTEYDAQIPPARSRLSVWIVHRESLEIQADYDAHIPPTSSPGQYRDSIEIQAEYDAQIPLHLDRLDAITLHNQAGYDAQIPPRLDRHRSITIQKQAQYEPQSPPKYSSFSVHFQTALKRHIPLTFLQKRLTFFNAFVHHSTEPFLPRLTDSKPTSN
jgi:hypothetical protein